MIARILLACALLIAPQAAAKDLHAGIVGADDRVILRKSLPAVGRLNIAGSGFCTATLIAPQYVLTAAHCLYYRRTGVLARPENVHFLADYRKGSYAAHRVAAKLTPHPKFTAPRPQSALEMADDLALVKLESPISGDEAHPLTLGPAPRPNTPLSTVSYARDRSELPSVEQGCSARLGSKKLLILNCDVNYGGSGGPILSQSEDGLHVVGVISGAAKSRGKTISLAASIFGDFPTDEFRDQLIKSAASP